MKHEKTRKTNVTYLPSFCETAFRAMDFVYEKSEGRDDISLCRQVCICPTTIFLYAQVFVTVDSGCSHSTKLLDVVAVVESEDI